MISYYYAFVPKNLVILLGSVKAQIQVISFEFVSGEISLGVGGFWGCPFMNMFMNIEHVCVFIFENKLY